MRPRTLSESNPDKTAKLNRHLARDVRQYSQSDAPAFLQTMTIFSIILPPLQSLPERFRVYFCEQVVSTIIKRSLEEAKVINWCRTVKPLVPLYTKGDGNCLLHAASIAMWGIHDRLLFLRNLLHRAFTKPQTVDSLKQRWKREKMYQLCRIPDFDIDTKDWEFEWQSTVQATRDTQYDEPGRAPFAYLEEIHIFTLSNILRRPIIVLGESVARTLQGSTLDICNFPGIYLPLMWKSSDVYKSPIVLAYDSNHFVPLVSQEDRPDEKLLAPTAFHAVPLVAHDLSPLHIHFLLQTEEETGYGAHNLLTQYLDITEVVLTKSDGIVHVLTAKLELQKIGLEFDIMRDFYKETEKSFQEMLNGPSEVSPHSSPEQAKREHKPVYVKQKDSKNVQSKSNTQKIGMVRQKRDRTAPATEVLRPNSQLPKVKPPKCKNKGCKFHGSPETMGLCSKCFGEYTMKNAVRPHTSPKMSPAVLRHQRQEKRWSSPVPSSAQAAEHRDVYNITARQDPQQAAAAAGYEYSMTSTQCQAPNCYYLASNRIYPYCHEHAYMLKPGSANRGQHQLPENATREQHGSRNHPEYRHQKSWSAEGSSFAGALRIPDLDENSIDTSMSRSLDDVLIKGKKNKSVKCNIRKCKFHGNPEHKNMCSEHYRQFFGNSPPDVCKKSPDEIKRPITRKRPGSREKCQRDNCVRVAEVQYGGLCNVCHLSDEMKNSFVTTPSIDILNNTDISNHPKENYQTKLMEECVNEGCKRIGTAQTEGYCTECFVRKTKHVQRLSQETTSENNTMPTVPLDPAQPLTMNEERKQTQNSPGTCATHDCGGVPLANGLCFFCYQDEEHQRHPPGAARDQNVVLPPTSVLNALLPPGEDPRPSTAPSSGGREWPMGLPVLQRQHSAGERSEPQSHEFGPYSFESQEPSMTSYEQGMSAVKTCHFPECENIGHEVLRGLCVECYNTLCEKAARQKPRVPATRVINSNKPPPPTAPARRPRPASIAVPSTNYTPIGAQHCLQPGCDRFGDPSFEGFCSNCYRYLMSIRPPEEEGPLRPFAQHPVSYANYLQIGAANHITIAQESHMITPHSSSSSESSWQEPEPSYEQAAARIETASRSSIAKCITPSCTNYGHSRNLGYCNSCFVKVKQAH